MKQHRYALWFGLAVGVLLVFAEVVLIPLHAAGRAQALLGYLIGGLHLFEIPGFTVSELLGLCPNHTRTNRGFILALVVNVLFWIISALIIKRILRLGHFSDTSSTETNDSDQPAPRYSRRQLLVTGGRAAAATTASAIAYGFFAEARWFEISRQQIPIKGLSPGLNGLRIVQLSDIHHGPWMSHKWVRQIIETTNFLAPDVVALTGDYVYQSLDYVEPVAAELARLRPRIGTVAVMGNHDWWENGQVMQTEFARRNIPLIDNDRCFVTPNRRLVKNAKEGLCLAGVGDLWEDRQLYDAALADVPGGMPRILLSHNPDVAEQPDFLQSGYRVDLMLSGHTHGGQIRLPGVGAPVTNSRFGMKYAKGLAQGPACPVFTSRGLGMTVMPIRLGVPPEIAVIELISA